MHHDDGVSAAPGLRRRFDRYRRLRCEKMRSPSCARRTNLLRSRVTKSRKSADSHRLIVGAHIVRGKSAGWIAQRIWAMERWTLIWLVLRSQ